MPAYRSDELLIGFVALGLLPWIAWTVRRGFVSARLPIGKGYVEQAERPRAFRILLILYIVAALVIAFIAVDLLFGLLA